MNKCFKRIIEEICEEEKIKYTFLSKDWITMLEKNGKTRYISGYKFDLNPHGLGVIADDKYALYEVLKAKNIPVIEHKIVFRKECNADFAKGCNTYEYVKEYFRKNNNSIVIKPNKGSCGVNVFHITNENEIDTLLDKVLTNNYSISICPFYKIKQEFRGIVLDKKVKLLFGKNLPVVYGDGIKTIKQLLEEFNSFYFKDRLNDSKYNKVLENGEKFEFDWKFNLSKGAIPKEVEDSTLANELTELVERTAKIIDLEFGSVDIIQTEDNKFFILEINSGASYISQIENGFIVQKEIYKEAIKKMFK